MSLSKPRLLVIGSSNTDLVVRCDRLPKPGQRMMTQEPREIPRGDGQGRLLLFQAWAGGRIGSHSVAGSMACLLAASSDEMPLSTAVCASGGAPVRISQA